MKRAVLFACLLLAACSGKHHGTTPENRVVQRDTGRLTQAVNANPLAAVDLSPLDISYYPIDYPVNRMTGAEKNPPLARVIYSRPHKGGRNIFGELLKYGEPWRLGANEATELELFSPATIQGNTVPRGRYVLYCIPGPNEWVIIFNRNLYSWGLKPDPAQDAYRFTIPVQKQQQSLEFFTMAFRNSRGGAELVIAWDDVLTRLPIIFNQ